MLILFIRDFRSALTDEVFHEAGEIVNLPAGQQLINEGVAVAVAPDPDTEDAPEPKPKAKK